MIARHLPRALLYAAAGFAYGVLLAAGVWAARYGGWASMDVLYWMSSAPFGFFCFRHLPRAILLIPLYWAPIGLLVVLSENRWFRRACMALLVVHYASIPLFLWFGDLRWSYLVDALSESSDALSAVLQTAVLYAAGQALIWWALLSARRRAKRESDERGPWQFTLKELLVVPVVLALALGAIVAEYRRAERQQRAVAELQKAGARVRPTFWHDGFENKFLPTGVFSDVFEVSCYNKAEIRDEHLAQVEHFPLLCYIDLTGTQITDAGLAHLSTRRYLSGVILRNTAVTDAGLRHLAKAKRLCHLTLSNTRITDAGLAELRELPRLRYLRLDGTGVTDAGMAEVGQMESLDELVLTGMKISDAGLRHLAGQTQLHSLDLSGTDVSDAGLRHLARLDELTYIDLANTGVTDRGIEHLKQVPLHELVLSGTRVTGTGFRTFTRLDDLSLLDLSDAPVNDAGLQAIVKAITSTEKRYRCLTLKLSGTRITDAGLGYLKDVGSLYELHLAGTAIGDAGIEHLALVPGLSSLNLQGTRITDAALPPIEKMGAHNVNLKHTQVTAAAKKAMQARLSGMNLDWDGEW